MQQQEKPRKERCQAKVISLKGYREAHKRKEPPIIHIKLLDGGEIEYETERVELRHAFQVLAGCYVVAGKAMMIIEEALKCRTENVYR